MTPKQKLVYDAFAYFGRPMRPHEIGKHLGYDNSDSINCQIKSLKKQGYLVYANEGSVTKYKVAG